jgi:hypothetical protein
MHVLSDKRCAFRIVVCVEYAPAIYVRASMTEDFTVLDDR